MASVSDPDAYIGFAVYDASLGANVVITSARGSKVAPEVENGGALTPNQPVYLAVTAGKVTQDIASLGGYSLLKVGFAITTTEMILKSDYAPVC